MSARQVVKMVGYVLSVCVATLDWVERDDICPVKRMSRRNHLWKDKEQSIPEEMLPNVKY